MIASILVFFFITISFPHKQAVGLVGVQLASHYEETNEKQAFEELITDAEWGIQLGKLGVSAFLRLNLDQMVYLHFLGADS